MSKTMEQKLQYLLDRREIEDQCIHYAKLVDTKQFDKLREDVFTEDCYIDYTGSGGEAGSVDETIAFLKKTMSVVRSQHLMSNIDCEISEDGKTAKVKKMLFNPMTFNIDGKDNTFFIGLWYYDDWVKTENGWKLQKSWQELSYAYNSPSHGN